MIGKFIEKLRKENNLSQDELASVLGISRPTYTLIEKGEREIKISEAKKLAGIFKISIDDLVSEKVSGIIIQEESHKTISKKEKEIRISVPQEKKDKFKQVLLYVLNKVAGKPNIGETVLYKLLYFIDFDYYEKFEEQLMGLKYQKNYYGPTPYLFQTIIDEMIKSKDLERVKSKYFTYPQTKYLPCKEPNLSILNGQEIEHINWEIDRFENYSASKISEFSHKDVPWISTEEGQLIEYESVFYRTAETSVRNYEQDGTLV